MRSRPFLFLSLFLCAACSSPESHQPSRVSSVPPATLQALQAQGITINAYVSVSITPDKKFPLVLDPATNNFKGDVSVPTGSKFDLTVVYTADDPVSGQTLQIARYIRRNLIATETTTSVSYEGDQQNWETTFDLSPGQANDLNSDGDAYNNFIEIGYGSNPMASDSLPLGASVNATHADPLFGQTDVSLPPPGADVTSALRGDQEIKIQAITPFHIQKIEIVSPTYGVDILSTSDEVRQGKSLRLRVHTARFGPPRQMEIVVRTTDEFGIVRDSPLAFAIFNSTDSLPPIRLQLGLQEGQVVRDATNFVWELDDPSGIDPDSIDFHVTRSQVRVDEAIRVTNDDTTPNRFHGNVILSTLRYPNGTYTATFSARDTLGNAYAETLHFQVANTTAIGFCGNQVIEASEECDDGNTNNADSCTNACRTARCGDGIVSSSEQCDDGNTIDNDACTNTCRSARCGDGIKTTAEECDDGNLISNDGCSDSCHIEPATITVASPAEGASVRDIVTIQATATGRSGISLSRFGTIMPSGLVDTDASTQNFQSVLDTRRMTEDQDFTLRFEAEDTLNHTTVLNRTVTVDNAPNINSFTREQEIIQSGSPGRLIWAVTNSTSLSIDNGIGTIAPSGSTPVSPSRTTTYTLTAIRDNHLNSSPNIFSNAASTTLRVNFPPEVSCGIPCNTNVSPGSVTFQWNVTNDSRDDAGCLGASSYDLQVEKSDHTVVFRRAELPTNLFDVSQLTGSEKLLSRTNYLWKVTARDSCGGSRTSSYFNFTTTDRGLVGWWRFNEASEMAFDSSGNAHPGTLSNFASSPWVSGASGGALSFDGIDDYVEVPNDPILNFGTGDLTLSLWVNRDVTNAVPLSKEDGSNGWALTIFSANHFGFSIPQCGTFLSARYARGGWVHVGVTRKGEKFFLYLDGRLAAAGTCFDANLTTTAPLRIGCANGTCRGGSGSPFQGSLDEVALYNRAMDVDEMRRECRRNDLTGIPCPDTKEPILLSPMPSEILPPTMAYWSWRGERGEDGREIYPDLAYRLLLDVDTDNDGIYDIAGQSILNTLMVRESSGDWHYVEDRGAIVGQNRNYTIHIQPVESGTPLVSSETTRFFSTDNSVLGWWKFEDNLSDWSGRSHAGRTFAGGGPDFVGLGDLCGSVRVTELLGRSYCFNGTGNYVEVSDSEIAGSDFDRTGALAITAWVNPMAVDNDEDVIVTKSGPTYTTGYGLVLNVRSAPADATSYFYSGYTGSESSACGVTGPVGFNEWHFVGGSRHLGGTSPSGYTASCFLDATSNTINSRTLGANGDSVKLGIGSSGGFPRHFFGLMDDVIIYNRGLTPFDMCNNYLAFCHEAGLVCHDDCVPDR